jgi:flagellar biosynthesis protein FlhF
MPEALQMIRNELGSDAVILNSKEVRTGGFFGMFGKRKIEVVAAMDEPSSQPAIRNTGRTTFADALRKPETPPSGGSIADRSHAAGPLYGLSQAARAYSQTAAATAAPREKDDEAVEAKAAGSGRLSAADWAESAAPEKPPGEAASAADPDRLMDEIRQMKDMMARLSRQLTPGTTGSESFRKLERILASHEVEEAVIERLIGEAARQMGDADEREAKELVKAGLRSILLPERVRGIQPESRILHFVGPTGVGKTTTIAKLAADQALRHRKKIGFMTSDTYRIAAVEQLKTYATILNAPLEVIHSPMDLGRAFQQLDGCDIIFMDTAGRNYRNELYVSELNSLLTTHAASETYLVLSMTTRYRDMKAIVEAFSRFRLDKVLFTKADETTTFGAPVNLLSEYPLQLSYIATGQNVPDDISLFHPERWIDRLLEENVDDQ